MGKIEILNGIPFQEERDREGAFHVIADICALPLNKPDVARFPSSPHPLAPPLFNSL